VRKRWQFQDLRIFSNRRVKAADAVEIPRAQGVTLPETLDTLFEWYKLRFTREEVSPGPGVMKSSNRKAYRQRVSGESGNNVSSYTSSGEIDDNGEKPVWAEACA